MSEAILIREHRIEIDKKDDHIDKLQQANMKLEKIVGTQLETIKRLKRIIKDFKVIATRISLRDVDSTNIMVKIETGGLVYNANGHINNRTNMVHLSADEEIDEAGLEEIEIDLDDIARQIENREIELN